MEGRLDEYVDGGGPPLVTVVDLKELNGRVTGVGCGSGILIGLLSIGDVVADCVCSLATSARGARP